MKNIEPKIKKLTTDILKDYGQGRTIDKMNAFTSPDMDVVVDILDKLQKSCSPAITAIKIIIFIQRRTICRPSSRMCCST